MKHHSVVHKNRRYKFDCGCVVAPEDAKYTRAKRGVGRRLHCPTHGEEARMLAYIYQCPDCGQDFTAKASGAQRCPRCAYKHKRALQKISESTANLRKGILLLAPIRKSDCQYYLSYCLPREVNNEGWSCRFCKKYKPVVIGACEYVSANDPMRAAYAWPTVW